MTPRASNKNSHSQPPWFLSWGQRCIVPLQTGTFPEGATINRHRAASCPKSTHSTYGLFAGTSRVSIGMTFGLQPMAGG